MLFVAATHCYRVVAAWRRSSLLFLSLFLPPTHTNTLSLSCSVTCSLPHTHCLCTSVLPHLPLPPPTLLADPPTPLPPLPLARHHQNIDILKVLQQLAVEINHSCKSECCLDVALHGLCMEVYPRHKLNGITILN